MIVVRHIELPLTQEGNEIHMTLRRYLEIRILPTSSPIPGDVNLTESSTEIERARVELAKVCAAYPILSSGTTNFETPELIV